MPKVVFSNQRLKDDDVEKLKIEKSGDCPVVDFSGNMLGAVGVQSVLRFCRTAHALRIVKLHRNLICDSGADAVATFLKSHVLDELHLSHNRITGEGAITLVDAACQYKPARVSPLWLRLEHNRIHQPTDVLRDLMRAFSVCDRDDHRICTTRSCGKGCRVHLPYFYRQLSEDSDADRKRKRSRSVERVVELKEAPKSDSKRRCSPSSETELGEASDVEPKHSVRRKHSKSSEQGAAIFYLPAQLRGVTVLKRRVGNTFVADNTLLKAHTSGIAYRKSKNLNDWAKTWLLRWGSRIDGVDEGDGWIKIDKAVKFKSGSLGATNGASRGRRKNKARSYDRESESLEATNGTSRGRRKSGAKSFGKKSLEDTNGTNRGRRKSRAKSSDRQSTSLETTSGASRGRRKSRVKSFNRESESLEGTDGTSRDHRKSKTGSVDRESRKAATKPRDGGLQSKETSPPRVAKSRVKSVNRESESLEATDGTSRDHRKSRTGSVDRESRKATTKPRDGGLQSKETSPPRRAFLEANGKDIKKTEDSKYIDDPEAGELRGWSPERRREQAERRAAAEALIKVKEEQLEAEQSEKTCTACISASRSKNKQRPMLLRAAQNAAANRPTFHMKHRMIQHAMTDATKSAKSKVARLLARGSPFGSRGSGPRWFGPRGSALPALQAPKPHAALKTSANRARVESRPVDNGVKSRSDSNSSTRVDSQAVDNCVTSRSDSNSSTRVDRNTLENGITSFSDSHSSTVVDKPVRPTVLEPCEPLPHTQGNADGPEMSPNDDAALRLALAFTFCDFEGIEESASSSGVISGVIEL